MELSLVIKRNSFEIQSHSRMLHLLQPVVQSAVAVEYTDFISAEG